jgi:hypothetical protein
MEYSDVLRESRVSRDDFGIAAVREESLIYDAFDV